MSKQEKTVMGAMAEAQLEQYHDEAMTKDTNPKDLIGIKKTPLRLVPPALIIEVAAAMKNGADKYGPYNWREKGVRLSVYLDAIERHLLAFRDGEDRASDSGVKHLAHAAACFAIIFDATALGMLVDDRPEPGPAAGLLEAYLEGEL